nr:hypothetical protein CFP56_03615 [Quercus suber]
MKSKEKADELKKALKLKKKLVARKDDELQATLLRTAEAKDGGEAIDLSTLDFEVLDTEMIVDEAQEEERQVAKEFSFVLTKIETEVEVETTAVGAEVVVAARGGDATNEGVDG